MKISPKLQQDARLLLSIAALVSALAVVIQPHNDYAFVAMMMTGLLNAALNASAAIAAHDRLRTCHQEKFVKSNVAVVNLRDFRASRGSHVH